MTKQIQKEKKGKKFPVGTVVFYGILFLLTVGTLITVNQIRQKKLLPFLEDFERSQPKYKCEEMFQELFMSKDGAPDWERLYSLAGIEDTPYEGAGDFSRYMQNRTAGLAISYTETSGGLAGKKYTVRAGDDKIASFLLKEQKTDDGSAQWVLGDVELFFERTASITAKTVNGHKLLIGGVMLDDSYQVQTMETVAEKYLPEGIHGERCAVWQIGGFLQAPQVTAADESGKPIELRYDAETDCYMEDRDTAAREITEEEKAVALTAAETYAKFMISAAKTADLRQCFDENSRIYSTVKASDTWMQGYKGYSFSEETVSEFYRYSENLFSLRIAFSLNVTRQNGSVKEYTLDSSFFFTRIDGKMLVTDMTNVDIQREIVKTRLVFCYGNEELKRICLSNEDHSFYAPTLEAEAGKHFAGWAVEEKDEQGNLTLTVRFQPDETGLVTLPQDYTPEPMTLYAVFESSDSENPDSSALSGDAASAAAEPSQN